VKIKHGKDEFLVLTSDGINFVMNDQEVVDCITR
jgi:serine/threonine protein phosphatase PrpC